MGKVTELMKDSFDSLRVSNTSVLNHTQFNRTACNSHDKATFINMENKTML